MNAGKRKQVGGAWYKTVELLDGEFVSKDANAHHWRGKWTSSFGRLYLTNLRLIFCGMPGLLIWRLGVPWAWETVVIDLDKILVVAPATNIPNHFLEDAYAMDLGDRKEVFSTVPAPDQQWLMEIKATFPSQHHNDQP